MATHDVKNPLHQLCLYALNFYLDNAHEIIQLLQTNPLNFSEQEMRECAQAIMFIVQTDMNNNLETRANAFKQLTSFLLKYRSQDWIKWLLSNETSIVTYLSFQGYLNVQLVPYILFYLQKYICLLEQQEEDVARRNDPLDSGSQQSDTTTTATSTTEQHPIGTTSSSLPPGIDYRSGFIPQCSGILRDPQVSQESEEELHKEPKAHSTWNPFSRKFWS